MRDLPPIHPGEQLREEFMVPMSLTAYRLAKDIGVPVTRIQEIVVERRAITGDTALRLALFRDDAGVLVEYTARFRTGNRRRKAWRSA